MCSTNAAVIDPGKMSLFDTGIEVHLPYGHVGVIKPRSEKALLHGIDVMGEFELSKHTTTLLIN
jgi:dUTPase